MTTEDEVYAGWLNLLGSDEIKDTNEDTIRDLHQMHVSAEVSHGCPCGSGSPEDFEGPRADCPLHGDPAILGYDPRENPK
jgi:hypothetical protein